jgi:hypothetical protein
MDGHSQRTMRDVAPKIPAYDTMPRRALAVIERLLDVLRDILLDIKLRHSLLRCSNISSPPPRTAAPPCLGDLDGWCRRTDINGLLLHILAHIRRLDLRCSRRRLAGCAVGGGRGRGGAMAALYLATTYPRASPSPPSSSLGLGPSLLCLRCRARMCLLCAFRLAAAARGSWRGIETRGRIEVAIWVYGGSRRQILA